MCGVKKNIVAALLIFLKKVRFRRTDLRPADYISIYIKSQYPHMLLASVLSFKHMDQSKLGSTEYSARRKVIMAVVVLAALALVIYLIARNPAPAGPADVSSEQKERLIQ